MRRPISIAEASDHLGIGRVAVLKRINRGTLLAVPLSNKGWMVCHEAVLGEPVDEKAFRRMCSGYISVPEACDIVCVTDGMVGRMLAAGVLDGFRLNEKSWAVSRRSCEDNIREYLAYAKGVGRKRRVGEPRRPAKRKQAKRKQAKRKQAKR